MDDYKDILINISEKLIQGDYVLDDRTKTLLKAVCDSALNIVYTKEYQTENSREVGEIEQVIGALKGVVDGVHPNYFKSITDCTFESIDGVLVCELTIVLWHHVEVSVSARMGIPVFKTDRPSIWEKAQSHSTIPMMVDSYINSNVRFVDSPSMKLIQ